MGICGRLWFRLLRFRLKSKLFKAANNARFCAAESFKKEARVVIKFSTNLRRKFAKFSGYISDKITSSFIIR